MAKLIVQNDTNPNIAIILKTNDETGEVTGICNQCGHWAQGWSLDDAKQAASIHIDRHDGEE